MGSGISVVRETSHHPGEVHAGRLLKIPNVLLHLTWRIHVYLLGKKGRSKFEANPAVGVSERIVRQLAVYLLAFANDTCTRRHSLAHNASPLSPSRLFYLSPLPSIRSAHQITANGWAGRIWNQPGLISAFRNRSIPRVTSSTHTKERVARRRRIHQCPNTLEEPTRLASIASVRVSCAEPTSIPYADDQGIHVPASDIAQ